MADRNHNRAYSAADRSDPNRQMHGDTDPLAELARLIGQTDPSYDRVSRPPHSTRPSEPAHDGADGASDLAEPQRAAGPPSWMLTRATPQKPVQSAPRDDTHPLRRYANSQPVQPQHHYEPPERHEVQHEPPPPAASERYDDVLYGSADGASDVAAHQDYFDEGYQQDPSGYRQDPSGYQDDYGHDAQDMVEKPRRGLKTVIAVLALAVVGTGAAFGYRTYVGSPRSGEPPIIKADAGPNKVVPPSASFDNSGKQIQDRLAAGSAPEQIVSREEQPVDVKDIAQSGPRVVFPSLNQNANPPTTASVAPNARLPANAANGVIAGSEPRKIKTVSVRPDRPDTAPKPTVAAQPPAASAVRAVHGAAAPNGNAPLSLTPQAGSEARTHIASSNPAQSIPAATTGGYVVQISSQRNEADARASFRVLQSKFPSSLGSRTPLIKRADLGSKGVYYRAMVGPFGSSEEAVHFCGNLKAAGGQCVVQRN